MNKSFFWVIFSVNWLIWLWLIGSVIRLIWFLSSTHLRLLCFFCNCMLNYNQYMFKRRLLSYDLKITWCQIFFKLVFYCVTKHGMWICSYSNQELASAKSALYSIPNPLTLNYWAIKSWPALHHVWFVSHTHTQNWIWCFVDFWYNYKTSGYFILMLL